ncbi:MAG: hypothetical protein ASARMPREDX12_004185 [Alectoria sarmentosa]|nr:MAG: hypothetical protein ASARMPRED_002118 [Alectoria sarmentosa]CAD6590083.1 MAG: hypothetical protein ASARMPREDX12_004185 [Alectoria sarmentosa]
MGKRKRRAAEGEEELPLPVGEAKKKKLVQEGGATPTTIQIILGTYEKVLHGITVSTKAQVKGHDEPNSVEFADTFLLNAHTSAIRCLAISPSSTDLSKSQKIILASGSSDQTINLYHLSTTPPQKSKGPLMPTLAGSNINENPRNRELGSLQHHSAGINALYFPTRSKLLSGAEDNTIAVARTRDWTVLSTIKAPIPKAHGRPSGDTAPFGGTPAGVNDFAIHPSMKLMVSVGKGEKCMRLWNLVTGKKAGILNFGRELLQSVGEDKWARGEGRRLEWNSLGEEFVVGFERGCAVFGMDSKPKCRILPSPLTKIHQLHYMASSGTDGETKDLLTVSTEDGRILFYDTTGVVETQITKPASKPEIPILKAICQLGGAAEGLTGRVKDFEILKPSSSEDFIIVTGSSDGAVRLWTVDESELLDEPSTSRDLNGEVGISANGGDGKANGNAMKQPTTRQVGLLLGTYEAGNRITCLKAFVMSEPDSLKTNGSENGITRKNGEHVDSGDKDSTSS